MRFTQRGAGVALLSVFLVRGAVAQDQAKSGPPQIVTTGQGEVQVTPDRATIAVGVQTRALTAAEASATNGRKQKAIIDAVRAKGVLAEMITTTGFNVQPEVKYDRQGSPPVTTGYLVSNSVTIQLQRTELAGAVIDASLAAGANQVHSLTFSISNPDSARRAALTIAVVRARGDAEAAARAAGGSLGTLIELTATDYDVPVFRMAAMSARLETSVADVTPVEAGLQPVRAAVTVRWQFVPPAK